MTPPNFRGARLSKISSDVDHTIDVEYEQPLETEQDPHAAQMEGFISGPRERGRRLGLYLIAAGSLTPEMAEKIAEAQQQTGLRFGETAVKLGFVDRETISRALAQQFQQPFLQETQGELDSEVIAALKPNSNSAEALRMLRSQLLLHWFNGGRDHRTLAICGAGTGEGRSWLAANLAVSFSHLGARTLLVDADLRHPRLHRLFGCTNDDGLSTALAERTPANIQQVKGIADLALLPAGPIPPNPQELLSRVQFGRLVDELRDRFDVILFDSPAASQSADALLIASRAGAALMLARRHNTRSQPLQDFCERLNNAQVAIVGSVMNDY